MLEIISLRELYTFHYLTHCLIRFFITTKLLLFKLVCWADYILHTGFKGNSQRIDLEKTYLNSFKNTFVKVMDSIALQNTIIVIKIIWNYTSVIGGTWKSYRNLRHFPTGEGFERERLLLWKNWYCYTIHDGHTPRESTPPNICFPCLYMGVKNEGI